MWSFLADLFKFHYIFAKLMGSNEFSDYQVYISAKGAVSTWLVLGLIRRGP